MTKGHNIQIFTRNPFANIIIIMTKTFLKLILCWASVNVGFAQDPSILVDPDAELPEIANVNFYCTTPGQVFKDDCSVTIIEGGPTIDDMMMDIFNRCVFHTTGTDLPFSTPDFPQRKRALRTAAAPANDEADRSLGHKYTKCNACGCSEICCMLGYCGSSCSCSCACERRRLEEENEILSILQGRQLQYTVITETTEKVTEAVALSCTAQVRSLALLLRSDGNKCLGDGEVTEEVGDTGQLTYKHEEISCTPAIISTSHGRSL
jgi:hypothetical protein